MDKAEKALAKKVKDFYESPSGNPNFTREENIILERWRALNMLNEKVFTDITSAFTDYKEYTQSRGYPFKNLGEQEINKNWYIHFRESKWIIYFRDGFTVIAFLLSLYLTVAKIFQK